MNLANNPTIAAIATAPGRGGIGIVRLSGQHLLPLAQSISRITQIKPRYAHYCRFYPPQAAEAVDDGLLLYFPAPHSFTGEDVIELHGHGGQVVTQMVLAACLAHGAVMAAPGEFSQRAFLNGKMDLAQAESVADLIDAASKNAAQMALRSLRGAFSTRVNDVVDQLIQLRMLIEATLDFPEEEEIDALNDWGVADKLVALQAALARLLQQAEEGALMREGMTVALMGAPNAGKSSLLNALAEDDIAIVTAIAGTTRDTLRGEILIRGVPIHIVDTAGLRDSDDEIERIGIEKGQRAIQEADVALIVVDDATGINAATAALLAKLPETVGRIEIRNKIDLTGQKARHVHKDDAQKISLSHAQEVVFVSAKTGLGMDLLKDAILAQAGCHGREEGLFLARTRHVEALLQAQEAVIAAGQHTASWDLMAEYLRQAQDALGTITGRFRADDLLGVIFSQFCLGK